MSGPLTAKFLRPMVVAVRWTLSLPEAADLVVCLPSSNQRVADSNLKLLCKCQRRSLFNVPFVFVFRLLKTDVAQQLQVV